MLIGCFEQVPGQPEPEVIQCQATKPFSLSLSLSVCLTPHSPRTRGRPRDHVFSPYGLCVYSRRPEPPADLVGSKGLTFNMKEKLGTLAFFWKIRLNVFHGGTDTDVTQGQSTHINPATPQSPMCEPLLAIPFKKHDFCRQHKGPPGLGSHVLLAGLSYHRSALWECFTLESKLFCLHWKNHIFKQRYFSLTAQSKNSENEIFLFNSTYDNRRKNLSWCRSESSRAGPQRRSARFFHNLQFRE